VQGWGGDAFHPRHHLRFEKAGGIWRKHA
jgi:hypothetical protein